MEQNSVIGSIVKFEDRANISRLGVVIDKYRVDNGGDRYLVVDKHNFTYTVNPSSLISILRSMQPEINSQIKKLSQIDQI